MRNQAPLPAGLHTNSETHQPSPFLRQQKGAAGQLAGESSVLIQGKGLTQYVSHRRGQPAARATVAPQ